MSLVNQEMEAILIKVRHQAQTLFEQIVETNLIQPGIKESELTFKIHQLAENMYGIKKYWHKRIVRSGKNTKCVYRENPPDRVLKEQDIVYIDLGPVFEDMEADYGRTYVLGNNPEYHAIVQEIESVWKQCRNYFFTQSNFTGNQLYLYMSSLAHQKGYQLAEWHCGHLVGQFPHEERYGEYKINYICPENQLPLLQTTANDEKRYWILEVHLLKPEGDFGAFFEDLLSKNILNTIGGQ